MEIGLMLEIGGIIVAVAGALAVARWRVDQAEKRLDKLQSKHEALEHEFNDYKVDAAEKYVTAAALGKFEVEIKSAVDRLTNRLDQVLSPTRGRR